MSVTSTHPGLNAPGAGDPAGVRVIRVPLELRQAAAARLVSHQAGEPMEAAARFLESAEHLNIDLELMWCTVDPSWAPGEGGQGSPVRQVCLAVIGSGRTAMLFLSGDERRGKTWGGAARFRAERASAIVQAERDRVALIRHACAEVGGSKDGKPPRAVLAQALLETREASASRALAGAGFTRLGDLVYMRRPLARAPGRALEQASSPAWPPGVRVRSIAELRRSGTTEGQVREWLVEALGRSYVETRDCPELCGLRSMGDVLESHESVGVLDPSLWWLVFEGERPEGCMLLTACPDHDSVELVYLGLGPALRGKGLGSLLLSFGLRRLYDTALAESPVANHPHVAGSGGVTCAVDTRNTPAMKLYKHAGFERFGVRVPFVCALADPNSEHA